MLLRHKEYGSSHTVYAIAVFQKFHEKNERNIVFYVRGEGRFGLEPYSLDEVTIENNELPTNFRMFFEDNGHPNGGVLIFIDPVIGGPAEIQAILDLEPEAVAKFESKQ